MSYVYDKWVIVRVVLRVGASAGINYGNINNHAQTHPPHHNQNRHVFHYIVEDGITYLCMTDDPARRRLPFAFLEDIKGRCVFLSYGVCVYVPA